MNKHVDSQGLKAAIITGISGQDGAYLSQYLLSKGYHVIGIYRIGARNDFSKLAYLNVLNDVLLIEADLTNPNSCKDLISAYKPVEVYNLAAQSSVSYSFSHPHETIEFNIISVLNLLEAIRSVNPKVKFYQASSSEMYGKVDKLPITGSTQLHPLSPYAISKATGHWMVSQYREAYGLFASSGILFNHESYLRPDTFFVKKVIQAAVRIKRGHQDELVVGNIDIKRDFGLASEYVKAIWLMMQLDAPQDFQVCSGESVSLRSIVYYVFDVLGLNHGLVVHDPGLYRPAEIADIYGDKKDIEQRTGWEYNLTFYDVLDQLIEEELINTLNGAA